MSMETDVTRREFLGLVPALAAATAIASPRAAHQDICDLGLREVARLLEFGVGKRRPREA